MIHRDGDWLAAKVGEELVMMSAASGNYIGLSPVAARIWELLETPQSVDSLCGALISEYEVDVETCRTEVDAFLTKLVEHRAVRID
jgi:hypothetical protein